MKGLQFVRRTLFVGLLFGAGSLFSATWNGAVAGTVTDDDIAITGDVTFTGDTTVHASSSDIAITLSGGARTLQPQGASRKLFLDLSNNHTITVTADYDLTFKGSGDYVLEIFVRSQDGLGGRVDFKIAGEQSVSFTSGSSGTKVYVVMTSGTGPTFAFDRNGGSDDKNVFVNVGEDSLITYVDANLLGTGGATDNGTIEFDATNTSDSSGRLVLNIDDMGGVVIASNYIDGSNVVHLDLPGAGQPRFSTVSSDATVNAGLLIISRNDKLFDLTSNPWINNAYDGNRYSFVLGNNATLAIGDSTYIDYVGTTTNQCPDPEPDIPGYDDVSEQSLIKSRNPSAFFVDGITTTSNAAATAATIQMGECSALLFRSGVNNVGVIENDISYVYSDTIFTINPENSTEGAGNVVFDVEGAVNVVRPSTSLDYTSAKIEVLSLAVDPTGGQLLSSGYSSCNPVFPLRTFSMIGDAYRAYNSAALLFNNNISLYDTSLVHTDVNHDVYEKNDTTSEPTYIGGEKFSLLDDVTLKPTIYFYDSVLMVQESIAFTGVDLKITNSECGVANTSEFIFFQNGYKVDDGTGRQMILGTSIGSSSCDGCSTICQDTQLDIMQTETCSEDAALQLLLTTSTNDCTIVKEICDGACTTPDLTCQLSVHTLYLGHASNISVGKQETITGYPLADLVIDGSFFSFETRGGTDCSPENSNITGQGGIFVDNLGSFRITPGNRASMATMVTKSGSGIVSLPKNQVFFDTRVGIADWWNSIPSEWVMISQNQCLSDYTLNWMALEKDYCSFVPYIPCVFSACPGTCPQVTEANITSIPTIQGAVEQFQVKASRLGDPVHIKVDGGRIRELVFLTGNHSAEAPVGVVVLENGAMVGLGSAHRDPDSVETSGLLGINGITLVVNEGENTVIMNSDLVINNVCHILKGPGPDGDYTQTVTLNFHSDVPRQLLVKTGGTLDLSSFDLGDTIAFTGNAKLVFEPGARLLLSPKVSAEVAAAGGVQVLFKDNAEFLTLGQEGLIHTCDYVCDSSITATYGLEATNAIRVKISGTGMLDFADNSIGQIDDESQVGIEGYDADGFRITDVTLSIRDAAQFLVAPKDGGTLQTGNTTDISGSSVVFRTFIDNYGKFLVGARGLVGYGVGVYNDSKQKDGVPNTWQVAPTYNVVTTYFDWESGSYIADQPGDGTSMGSSLVAFGTGQFNLTVPDPASGVQFGFSLLGGSPIMAIDSVTSVSIGNKAEDGIIGVLESFSMGLETTSAPKDNADFLYHVSLMPLCYNNCLGVATFSGGEIATTSEIGKQQYMAVIYRLLNDTIVRTLNVATIVKNGKPTGVWTRFDHTNKIGTVVVTDNGSGTLIAASEFAGD